MKFRLIFFALLLCVSVSYGAQRGAVSENGVKKIPGSELFSSSYAFVAGVDRYDRVWPALPGVKSDTEKVASALKNYGFDVVTAENLSKAEFISEFSTFMKKHADDPNARVLVYFAGHGYTAKKNGAREGYIVLRNAGDPNAEMKSFTDGSLPMSWFSKKAKEIKARQVLFVFDSCFAGSIFTAMRSIPEFVINMLSKPVREFITSGNQNQMVPDESVFRRRFVQGISGDADDNGDGIITGTELGYYLQKTVSSYSAGTQTPVYGKMKGYSGEFAFFLKDFDVRSKTVPGVQKKQKKAAPVSDSDEKATLLAMIKKNPHSPEAYNAMKRLREIDPSLKNTPPVNAPARKDFTMSAHSAKYMPFPYGGYPYIIVAPLFVPSMSGGFTAALRIKAKDPVSYRKLKQREGMMKSVMSRRLKESNLQLVDNLKEIRKRIRAAGDHAAEWVCPGCISGEPTIAGLKGL